MDVVGVVLAAGRECGLSGRGSDALCALDGVPLVAHAVRTLRSSGVVDAMVVCAPAGMARQVGAALAVHVPGRPVAVVDECDHGVMAQLCAAARFVVVHDCWHPLAPPELVDRVLAAVDRGGADVAVPVVDVTETVKELDPDGWIVRTVPRETLCQTQSPWAVRPRTRAGSGIEWLTDPGAPMSLVDGCRVVTVSGHPDAFALRTPADLDLAAAVLRARRSGLGPGAADSVGSAVGFDGGSGPVRSLRRW